MTISSTRRLEVAAEFKRLRKGSPDDVVQAFYGKREKLQQQIDAFRDKARSYLIGVDKLNGSAGILDDHEWSDAEDEEYSPDTLLPAVEKDAVPPEKQLIPLPSSFGAEACNGPLGRLALVELDLRIGQANDILRFLRTAIGQKSFLYRTNVRHPSGNSGYRKTTRSYAEVQAVELTITQGAKVYSSIRTAMERLGADGEVMERFQKLEKEDLKASTAVIDPNARGEREKTLSWIWRIGQPDGSADPEWLDERKGFPITTQHYFSNNPVPVYRVNWLRAKSRFDRCKEEVALVSSEMEWTKLFYGYAKNKWLTRARASAAKDPSMVFYALREAYNWGMLENHAQAGVLHISQ